MRTIAIAAVFAACCFGASANSTGIDPAQKHAWGENIGWLNAGPTNHVVTIHFDGTSGHLSGYAWGENIGWIRMGASTNGPFANTSSSNWGVNLDVSGNLSGYAWGENIGWINFDHANCDAAINLNNGEFSGHAYGENIGWVKFKGASPDYGVRTLAFDKQPQGTPNWWLDGNSVTETSDEGDGIPAWKEFVADTDPNDSNSFFQVVSVGSTGTTADVVFWPASSRRSYTLKYTDDLTSGVWSNVTGQAGVTGSPDAGQEQSLTDPAGDAPHRIYAVDVSVSP